jgi:hypothetical protein
VWAPDSAERRIAGGTIYAASPPFSHSSTVYDHRLAHILKLGDTMGFREVILSLGLGVVFAFLLSALRARRILAILLLLAAFVVCLRQALSIVEGEGVLTRNDFLFLQLGVLMLILCWWLIMPKRVWRHPYREFFLSGFSLLVFSLLIIILDHPRLWASGQDYDSETHFSVGVMNPKSLDKVEFYAPTVRVQYDDEETRIIVRLDMPFQYSTKRTIHLAFVLPDSAQLEFVEGGSCKSKELLGPLGLGCTATLPQPPSEGPNIPAGATPLEIWLKWPVITAASKWCDS